MSAQALFRTRFPFVCDRCDLGYRSGRLAGWDTDHRMVCATCLVGADPDRPVDCTDTTHRQRDEDGICTQCNPPIAITTSQESKRTCQNHSAPTLFD